MPDRGAGVAERIILALAEPFEIAGQRRQRHLQRRRGHHRGREPRRGAAAPGRPRAVRGEGRRQGPVAALPVGAAHRGARAAGAARRAGPGGRRSGSSCCTTSRSWTWTTGAPLGFEALVRWNHPTRGMVAPGHFIEVAEESGLIVPLGRMGAAAGARTPSGAGSAPPAPSALRTSASTSRSGQFRTPGFVEQVAASCSRDLGLPPGTLLLEITESLLLRDDEQVKADLAALRAMGVRLAIDDFGTGYSSLSLPAAHAVDVLKIDKSFIDDIAGRPSSSARSSTAIVQLAQTLDLAVVAEGVEEPGRPRLLREHGLPVRPGLPVLAGRCRATVMRALVAARRRRRGF